MHFINKLRHSCIASNLFQLISFSHEIVVKHILQGILLGFELKFPLNITSHHMLLRQDANHHRVILLHNLCSKKNRYFLKKLSSFVGGRAEDQILSDKGLTP